MKWSFLSIFIILFLVPSEGLTQDFELNDTSKNILYLKELKYGMNIHTQGMGANVTWGKNISAFKRRSWVVELNTFKALKEQRVVNVFWYEGKSYIYGKVNKVYNFRFGRLIEKQITRKPYWRGVELRWFYQYGLNLGLAKPYYLLVIDDVNGGSKELVYASHVSDENIIGRARFIKGISETKLHPGAHFKLGVAFDYGIFRTSIKEFTTGIGIDIFPYPMKTLAGNSAHYYFLTAFLGINIGKRK